MPKHKKHKTRSDKGKPRLTEVSVETRRKQSTTRKQLISEGKIPRRYLQTYQPTLFRK